MKEEVSIAGISSQRERTGISRAPVNEVNIAGKKAMQAYTSFSSIKKSLTCKQKTVFFN